MASHIDEISQAYCLSGQEVLKHNLARLLSKIPPVKYIAMLKKWRCARDMMPQDPMSAALLDLLLQMTVRNHLAFDRIDGQISFLDRQIRLAQKSKGQESGADTALDFLHILQQSFVFCGPLVNYSKTIAQLVCVDDRISARQIWIYSPGMVVGDSADYITGRAIPIMAQSILYHTSGPVFWLPNTIETPKGRLSDLLGSDVVRSDMFWSKLLRSYFKQDFPRLLERRYAGGADFPAEHAALLDGPEGLAPEILAALRPSSFDLPQMAPPAPRITLDPADPVENCLLNWTGAETGAVGRDRIRLHASLKVLCIVLHIHLEAETAHQTAIAEVAKEAVFILAETLIARDSAGIRTRNADAARIRASVRKHVATGDIPPKGIAIIEDITNTILQSGQSTRSSNDPEVAKIIARIAALEMRTTDRGFSEQEAYLAARKLSDLLNKYGDEIEATSIVEYPTEAVQIETGRKRRAPVYYTMRAVAAFCDCKHWVQKDHDGVLTYHIFGLRQDSYAAQSLFELIEQMFERERQEFQMSDAYRAYDRGGRKAALHAFEHGLANRITQRLDEIKHESREKAQSSNGRDLVVLKDRKIEEDLDLLGMAFSSRALTRTISDTAAFEEGYRRGENFNI